MLKVRIAYSKNGCLFLLLSAMLFRLTSVAIQNRLYTLNKLGRSEGMMQIQVTIPCSYYEICPVMHTVQVIIGDSDMIHHLQ